MFHQPKSKINLTLARAMQMQARLSYKLHTNSIVIEKNHLIVLPLPRMIMIHDVDREKSALDYCNSKFGFASAGARHVIYPTPGGSFLDENELPCMRRTSTGPLLLNYYPHSRPRGPEALFRACNTRRDSPNLHSSCDLVINNASLLLGPSSPETAEWPPRPSAHDQLL